MLDIKFIKENPDLIKEAARKKHLDFDVDAFLEVEQKRVSLIGEVEGLRAKQKKVGEQVARTGTSRDKVSVMKELKDMKDELQEQEAKLTEVMKEWQGLMLQVPNIPDVSVPEGGGEPDNQEVLIKGAPPKFEFEPKDHIELMTKLQMIDLERGTKAHGFRGYFLQNAGADLSWAVWNYARAFFSKRDFRPFVAPAILKKEFFYATGHLPREAEDLYKTQDDDYLSGTAEVPMMAYHGGEILNEADLPKRYLAFSPCYRREAGSHGKDIKGLIRVQEFFKLEQLIICRADHAESEKFHEETNKNYEDFIESLGLPFRRVLICGGDLGGNKVKQYDTEIWFPSQQTYREGSSAAYYHDFQTRRFNIRYRAENGKPRFAHSLNCTAAATPRLLAALVENYQQADGSIKVPEALVPYMDQEVITSPHGQESPRAT
ncbi:MAG: serine--tRNA ligase [Patescibacteria group bacterium]|nr:serine--tRNA ligase [Patescibacteria group bacterium]